MTVTGYKFQLVRRDGSLFEETTLRVDKPEAIWLGEKVFLPTKKPGVYREASLAIAPMPYYANFSGR